MSPFSLYVAFMVVALTIGGLFAMVARVQTRKLKQQHRQRLAERGARESVPKRRRPLKGKKLP
jgi:hypothetical protein